MNKKASSSGKIKPPMAAELLDHYTPEQLRCHWLSLGLDQKAVSFSPKPYDTSVSHKDKKTGEEVLVKDDPRVVDPALKESAFLTNIFNRLARSCFYGAAEQLRGHLPASPRRRWMLREATLAYERCLPTSSTPTAPSPLQRSSAATPTSAGATSPRPPRATTTPTAGAGQCVRERFVP
jgi:methionyl-tRNA synthetase